MMSGKLRTLRRNVYRTWLGCLVVSVLLTCLLLYSWKPLSVTRLYHMSSTTTVITTVTTQDSGSLRFPQHPGNNIPPFPALAFPGHRPAYSRGHTSVLSGGMKDVRKGKGEGEGKAVVDQPPYVIRDKAPGRHPNSLARSGVALKARGDVVIHKGEDFRPGVISIGTPDPDANLENDDYSTSRLGHTPTPGTLRVVGKSSVGAEKAVLGRGKNINPSVPGRSFRPRHTSLPLQPLSHYKIGFSDVSDIDVRLLSPGRSGVGEGEGKEVCSPHNHLVLVKVHKAASSTVANIVQRYGFTRDLNFVLPNRRPGSLAYNYISKRNENFTLDFILPPPPGQHYHLLWNHAIYNRTLFRSFMPRDTVYVSILREPFQQFVSAFAFYNVPYIQHFINVKANPFSHYLHRMPHPYLLDYFRNKQAEDLGMGPQHILNATLRQQYIQQLSEDLPLVLITEFFDESLVLLRRLMCWSVKDVLYASINKNSFKPIFVFSPQDYAKHLELAQADYDLYGFFRGKFLRTLAALGEDFEHELAHFKDVLKGVQRFCQQGSKDPNMPKQFVVPRSPWSDQFSVTPQDCQLLVTPELMFLNKLVNASLVKLQKTWPQGLVHVPTPKPRNFHNNDVF